MALPSPQVLKPSEIEHFIQEGYVVIRGATTRADAKRVQDKIWQRLGMDANDRTTWTKPIVSVQESFSGNDIEGVFSQRLLGAMTDLMGAGRWELAGLLGWFPCSFPGFSKPPWQPPVQGWHVDGSHFHHRINSKEQGLLPIHLFTDISPGGGGTAILPGSHLQAAKVLAQAEPEGLSPAAICKALDPYAAANLSRTVETTGEMGDVVLLHPFMMHSMSANTGDRPRFISNPCHPLLEPMDFHRADPADFSPVERAILLARVNCSAGPWLR